MTSRLQEGAARTRRLVGNLTLENHGGEKIYNDLDNDLKGVLVQTSGCALQVLAKHFSTVIC